MNQPPSPVAEPLLVSVLIPAKDEAGNIGALADEIADALQPACPFEVVLVDDGSSDDTGQVFLARCQARGVPAQLIRHQRSCGQSTALWTASRHARGRYVVTIDGDGQNDPADIPALVRQAQALEADGAHFCIAGFRHRRKDTEWKKLQSKIANKVRRQILDDGVPDTGCGLKLIPRQTWLLLPYFDHMHRYIPALVRRLGGRIAVVPVNHRHRTAGVSKYTAWNRVWVGIVDMVGVRWLIQRSKLPVLERVESTAP
ncbi:dolichol-phosphate mannosyltransferase [Hydrogenophaga electricum]|uniref:Dolichol-phosphate mannosyltransferase n=1 Tax=Hydrogenophaga electricum TaxID=1230953 RepID=A0ABQ6CCZ8_9BURK|nr:dolichol-phosphate mannosyltransferase [Hydrogenophaga electricum]